MTIQQLDTARNARPFRPFSLHMGDGRTFPVPHPEFLSRSPTGRTVIVYGDDDQFSILDLLLMTGIEFHPPATAGGSAA